MRTPSQFDVREHWLYLSATHISTKAGRSVDRDAGLHLPPSKDAPSRLELEKLGSEAQAVYVIGVLISGPFTQDQFPLDPISRPPIHTGALGEIDAIKAFSEAEVIVAR